MKTFLFLVLVLTSGLANAQFAEDRYTLFLSNYTDQVTNDPHLAYGDSLYHALIFKGDSVVCSIYHLRGGDKAITDFNLKNYYDWISENHSFTAYKQDGNLIRLKVDPGYTYLIRILSEYKLEVTRTIKNGMEEHTLTMHFVRVPYKTKAAH